MNQDFEKELATGRAGKGTRTAGRLLLERLSADGKMAM